MANNIHETIQKFQNLWNEAAETHRSSAELGELALQLRSAKCNDSFLLSELSEEEKTAFSKALLLANGRAS